MSSNTALRVHTPNEVAPLPAKEPGTAEQFEALFHHPEAKARIAPLLAPGDEYERIVALAMRASRKMPDLLLCTRSTLLDAAATIVGWNLEIGETAHMVPFNVNMGTKQKPAWEKHCTPIMDYKGMAQILIASRVVRAVDAYCVYEKEAERGDFQIFGGTDARIVHQPMWKGGDRGKMIGAYVVFQLANSRSKFHFMRIEEIDAIRIAYSKKWAKDYQGNVIPCPPWWAIKCCIRQARKLLATTPALEKAFNAFRQEEESELAPPPETRALPPGEEMGSPADAQPLALVEDKMLLERTMPIKDALAFIIPVGKAKDQRLDTLTPVQLRAALHWTLDNDTQPEFQLALATVLDAGALEAASDVGASEDSPAGDSVTAAPVATPAPFALEEEDPYPEADPKSMSTAALQAEIWRNLKHPSMSDAFVAGTRANITSETTHIELQKIVRELRAMIATAPEVRRKGERHPHTLGKLPGGV